jgi:hypothetical protein
MNGISLLSHSIQRMLVACEAMGVKPSDVRLSDFDTRTRLRLEREASQIIRDYINGKESA